MDINKLPPLEDFFLSVDLQIRFNDIDILGHLNNTVYFSFYDTGKAYFFEHLMRPYGGINWKKVESVIANVDCAYAAPIYFGEEIEVWTRCMSVHEKSFRIQQVIVEKRTRQVKSACETVMVSFDPETKESKEVPYIWREALVKSMEKKEAR